MTQMPALPDMILEPLVRAALIEDLGTFGDITTRTVIPAGTRYTARIRAREAGVVSGMQLAANVNVSDVTQASKTAMISTNPQRFIDQEYPAFWQKLILG